MPAYRAPKAKLIAKGSIMKNPKLFRGRDEPETAPLGSPSAHLNDRAREAWAAFACEIPWLGESDRAVLEIACHIRARLMSGIDVSPQSLTVLRQCLSAMGATPADRSRVTVQHSDRPDETTKYFDA